MLNVLPLTLDFQLRTAYLLFAIVKLKANLNFAELFRQKTVYRSIRTKDGDRLLEVPFTRHERERTAFGWWGCILWNSIPTDIRNELTIKYSSEVT
jgi:hypothetical protein